MPKSHKYIYDMPIEMLKVRYLIIILSIVAVTISINTGSAYKVILPILVCAMYIIDTLFARSRYILVTEAEIKVRHGILSIPRYISLTDIGQIEYDNANVVILVNTSKGKKKIDIKPLRISDRKEILAVLGINKEAGS